MRLLLLALLLSTDALAGSVSILTPGAHHGAAVKKPGQGWLGLFATKLAPVTLKTTKIRDPILDEGEPAAIMTGIEVSVEGPEQPLLLIKGLASRKVSQLSGAAPLGTEKPVMVGEATLTVVPREGGHQLVFTRGEQQQVLYEQSAGDLDGWWFSWAGDLDGDGQPDLILTADSHYNVTTTRLFLSSRAAKGQLVREVAQFRTVGC